MPRYDNPNADRRRLRRQRARRALPGVRLDRSALHSVRRLPAAGEHHGADRHAAERAAGVSGGAALLPGEPARAARADRRSGRPLSAALRVHQRHDADPARELRRAVRRGDAALPDRPRRRWPSTSDRTTARCSSNFHKGGHRVCGIEPTDTHKLARRARHSHDQRVLRPGGGGAASSRSTAGRRSSPPPTSSPTSRTSTRSSNRFWRCWTTTASSSPSRTTCCR